MSDITERDIQSNGLKMHIAEAGEGPLVVLCHGFPESWYSWRHQLRALSDAGYHVVAPDQRGYGGTDAPPNIDDYTIFHLVGDIVGLVNALGESQAVVVGHDWGSPVAWNCAMLRPDVFRAVASLSVPIGPRGSTPPLVAIKELMGDRFFYQLYFQTPGVAEHELQNDIPKTMRKMLFGASGSVNRNNMFERAGDAPPDSAFMLERMPDPGDDLPDWLTQEDVDYYVSQFEKAGFRGGLNWYRNIDRNWVLSGSLQGMKIEQPAFFMTGTRDVVPYSENAKSAMLAVLSNLKDIVVLPDIGHWTQQEAPDAVNEGLIGFLNGLG
ncbi:MAG: alpha/beta hydrolase [Gammaproteobacteria bacterium]|nr:alpha/beta hydrolase [Gammaproteobacteria bacterium]